MELTASKLEQRNKNNIHTNSNSQHSARPQLSLEASAENGVVSTGLIAVPHLLQLDHPLSFALCTAMKVEYVSNTCRHEPFCKILLVQAVYHRWWNHSTKQPFLVKRERGKLRFIKDIKYISLLLSHPTPLSLSLSLVLHTCQSTKPVHKTLSIIMIQSDSGKHTFAEHGIIEW